MTTRKPAHFDSLVFAPFHSPVNFADPAGYRTVIAECGCSRSMLAFGQPTKSKPAVRYMVCEQHKSK